MWLAFAFAQEADLPQSPPAEDELDDERYVSEEIIVYSREQMDKAREEVISELKQLGYEKRIEKGDAVVMRHASPWRGDVWLHDDGWMRIKRQPVRLEAPSTGISRANSAGAWAACVLLPFRCVRTGGQTVSKRKFEAVETRTAGAVNPEVSTWSDRVADYRISGKLESLPAQLAALWSEGVPLQGDEAHATVDDRKAALLRYWETRTDNPWGEAVREAVEAFIRGEVQYSEHPFTEAEILAFNRVSRAGRPLDLERRR